jgi:hypothetical protein
LDEALLFGRGRLLFEQVNLEDRTCVLSHTVLAFRW